MMTIAERNGKSNLWGFLSKNRSWYFLILFLFLNGRIIIASALVVRDCYSKSPNSEEKIWLSKFCTNESLSLNNTVFPYPGNITNFLICTDIGTGCPGHCPPWHIFEPSWKKCLRQPTTTPRINICPLPPGTNLSAAERPWPQDTSSPCKHMPGGLGCYYLESPQSRTFYIMCTPFNRPTYRSCERGLVWKQNSLSCELPDVEVVSCDPWAVNPCRQLIKKQKDTLGELFFPCKGEPKKYMQCSKRGKRFVKNCRDGFVWIHSELTCGHF